MTGKKAVYVFSEDQKELLTISRKIKQAAGIYLFLDYDGTLTAIRQIPSEATLSPAAKTMLAQLSVLPDVDVFIVTGRSMKDILRLVSLRSIVFAANHGLHIRYGAESEWIHVVALASLRTLAEVRTRLRPALKPFPGAFVENKELTLSVHFRNCAPRLVPSLKNAVTQCVCSTDPALRITKGKKVLEIRPDTSWGKSDAVMELLTASDPPEASLSIYIGDDTTDEEAFRVLRPAGVTVHVGKTMKTNAQYYVNDVQEVHNFMQLIHMMRLKDMPRSE